MKNQMSLNIILYASFWMILVVLFSWGGAYATYPLEESYTSGDDPHPPSCPDILVQKGNAILLYNTNQPEDESNPVVFSSLDEYTQYVDQQRAQGLQCPLLYLTKETTTQGRDVYRARNYALDEPVRPEYDNSSQFRRDVDLAQALQKPQTAASVNWVVNSDGIVLTPEQINAASQAQSADKQGDVMYAGFDPTSQNVGTYSDLDAIHDSTVVQGAVSENPIDPNWGGVRYSQKSVNQGNYSVNEVSKPLYFNATNVSYIPGMNSAQAPYNYY